MNNTENSTLILTHATILTMDEQHTVLTDGALVISNDRILSLGKTADLLQQYPNTETLDCTDTIIIPGLINAHSHIPMSYFKGLADDMPLEQWLQGYIWPLESKLLNAQFVYDSTLHGAAEMIMNGITLTSDMYFFGNEIAKAITVAGLRGILGEAVVDFRLEANGGLDSLGQFALRQNELYRDNPLVDFSLSPHSIYACSTPTLSKLVEVALKNDLLIHMHMCETVKERKECLAANGAYPVPYLQSIGMLETRLVLAHGIWINPDEMHLLARDNVAVAICTESNMKLASGIAPLKAYLDNGVRLCFGTDGVASNNNLDLLSELDFTAKLHKAVYKDPTFLPAEQMLHRATAEAAKALHRYDELGSLECGKKADITVLDCHTIEGQPLYNPYSQVVYALGGKAVRDVIINGEVVLRDKKLTKLDAAELIDTAKRYKTKIMDELNQ